MKSRQAFRNVIAQPPPNLSNPHGEEGTSIHNVIAMRAKPDTAI